jgi:microcompartment protein CcmK/EutM
MNLGRVSGCLWASAKHKSLCGAKLLIVSILNADGTASGSYDVAFDTVEAGIDDIVLTVKGSSSQMTAMTEKKTIDCTIIGIVDHVEK